MRVSLETIIPKKAAEWLKLNTSNRPLSVAWIERLAAIILDGQWRINGDAIRFDLEGRLLDGQHRLHAVLVANKPIESYVARGVSDDAFDTIDQGHKRTNADVLARRGEKHYVCLAAAASRVWQYENRFGFGQASPRPDQLDAILGKHSGLRSAVEMALSFRSKLISPSDLSFFIYWTRRIYGENKADPFWASVANAEGLKKGTPAHMLYRRLVDHRDRVAKLPTTVRVGICIKAFNAYVTGKTFKLLRVSEYEDAPRFLEPKR